MLMSIRGIVAVSLLAGCGLAATPAFAQDGESDITISGNAALVSEYRFRGLDVSGGDIAIQGGVNVGHSSGFYAGVSGSSIDEDTYGKGHTELAITGGWSGAVASGVSATLGVVYYAYPNGPAGDTDFIELQASAAFTLGPAGATVGVAYAPDQDTLGSTDNLYVYTNLGVGIPNTPVSLSAHVGYTDGALTFTNDGDAFDWSVGADFAINENLSVGVAYVDVEGDFVPGPGAYNFTDGAIVGTLSVSF